MLDFAEFVAINKFDRKGAADTLRDVAKQVQRNKEAFTRRRRDDAGVRHHGQPFQRRRRHRAVPGPAPRLAALGLTLRAAAHGVRRAPQHATRRPSCRPPRTATSPRSPTPCAYYKRMRAQQATLGARTSSNCARGPRCAGRHQSERRRAAPSAGNAGRRARGRSSTPAEEAARQWPTCRRPTPATSTW